MTVSLFLGKEEVQMQKAQYGILRFAKYKGPEISNIEAHNERKKEKYASNPDIDNNRRNLNYHFIEPVGKYRAESNRLIEEYGCRTRKDSVRVVEVLITATPEFFKGKKKSEIRAYFQTALEFIEKYQDSETILSAVVHMDEKTPHMHLSFVPITQDGRLCAKEILGNKKKLTWWQDEFWKHMVEKYPDLERGESASMTGREHIPPRLLKKQHILPGRLSRLLIYWKIQISLMPVKIQIKQWNFYRSFSPQWRTFRHRFGNMIRRLVP